MTLLGLFRKNPSETGLELVKNLLVSQDERLRSLERSRKDLELEWENTYQKVHKAVARLNKAQRDLEKAEDRSGDTNGPKPELTPTEDFRSRVLKRRRTHAR